MKFFEFLKKKSKTKYILEKYNKDYISPSIIKAYEQVLDIRQGDMEQFTMIPYQLNCQIFKYLSKERTSFAYMFINQPNYHVVVDELKKLNLYILQASEYVELVYPYACIRTRELKFKYNEGFDFTRLVCTPYTPKKLVSKYPLYLHFTTGINSGNDYEFGKVYYGRDGKIAKAEVIIWRNHIGWLFKFKTLGRTLLISEIESTLNPDEYGRMGTIYKFEE